MSMASGNLELNISQQVGPLDLVVCLKRKRVKSVSLHQEASFWHEISTWSCLDDMFLVGIDRYDSELYRKKSQPDVPVDTKLLFAYVV